MGRDTEMRKVVERKGRGRKTIGASKAKLETRGVKVGEVTDQDSRQE